MQWFGMGVFFNMAIINATCHEDGVPHEDEGVSNEDEDVSHEDESEDGMYRCAQ